MKQLFTGCLLLVSCLLFAQDEERNLTEGTTFNYLIKEGKLSYKLKAVLKQWDYETIQFAWQTTSPKVAKGTITMSFSAIGESNKIRIKPKAGNTTLPKDVCGWVLPYDVFDSLFNRQLVTNTSIDGVIVKLKPGKMEEAHTIKYNSGVQTVLYGEGIDEAKKMKLGFIEFYNDILIVSLYTSGSFSMTLDNVTAPKKKASE